MKLNRLCLSAFGVIALLAGSRVSGYTIMDPTPALTWEQVPTCGLVIEGVYDSYADNILSLKVVRVLKGDGVKEGAVVNVTIANWYSVSPGGPGFDMNGANIAVAPMLCRKSGYNKDKGFGDITVADLRKPMVYFFPNKDKPALGQIGQVQDGRFVDDWAKLVLGQPTEVSFRIAQTLSFDVTQAALKELAKSRDPKAIERVVKWMFEESSGWIDTQGCFTALGDKDGDVINPLLKRFDGDMPLTQGRGQLAYAMALADSKRAGVELIKRATDGPRKDEAAEGLRWVANEQALGFLLDHVADRPDIMLNSVVSILHMYDNRSIVTPDISDAEVQRLRHLAKPKLEALLKSDKLDQKTKDDIRKRLADDLAPPSLVIPDSHH